MNELILKACEFLSVLLPFGIVFLLCKKRGDKAMRHNIVVFAFAVYIFAVFYFTGISKLYDVMRIGFEFRKEKINLVPFSRGVNRMELFLNVLLFVPLGFLLPLLWAGYRKFGYTLLTGFCFSLFIECAQLFNHRSTDVNDVVMNTLGAVVGYITFRIFSTISKPELSKPGAGKKEAIFYIASMFLGRFLLFNEYGIANAIYGF